jgi:hypothetical protein
MQAIYHRECISSADEDGEKQGTVSGGDSSSSSRNITVTVFLPRLAPHRQCLQVSVAKFYHLLLCRAIDGMHDEFGSWLFISSTARISRYMRVCLFELAMYESNHNLIGTFTSRVHVPHCTADPSEGHFNGKRRVQSGSCTAHFVTFPKGLRNFKSQ